MADFHVVEVDNQIARDSLDQGKVLLYDAAGNPIKYHDLDSGAGTENNIGVSLRKAASGGSVPFGTIADPLIGALSDGTNGPAAVKAASTAPTVTDKALVVVISPNQVAIPVSSVPAASDPGIAFGDPALASTSLAAVRRTAYTEQITNFSGSIVSSSANDSSGGTGLRTIKITYYDQTGAGPYTNTFTMNGTTPVNLTGLAGNMCFIEQIEGITVGSGLVAAGTITLKSAVAGGGTTIGTIAVGDVRTFWAHHYVPTGKTCSVTGTLIGSNSTVAGNGSVFLLKSIVIGATNQVEAQIGDFLTLFGQSSQTSRNYGSYIQVPGPARIVMYVIPVSGTSNVYRGSFDFYDS